MTHTFGGLIGFVADPIHLVTPFLDEPPKCWIIPSLAVCA
jgi:hypothetical protein